MTKLVKSVRTLYTAAVPGVPGVPGTPGTPGVPGIPGHWESITTTTPAQPARVVAILFNSGGPNTRWLNAPGSMELIGSGPTATGTLKYYGLNGVVFGSIETFFAVPASSTTVNTWIPATAAIPPVAPTPDIPATPGSAAVTTTDSNLGWNSSAVSIRALDGNLNYTFRVTESTIGVVTGLNSLNQGSGYKEIDYGFYLTGGKATVYEGGVPKTAVFGFGGSDNLEIVRIGGVVTYYRDAELVYTSGTVSTGPVFVDAALFSAGDQISTSSFESLATGEGGGSTGYMLPLGGLASDFALRGAIGYMLPLEGVASDYLANSSAGYMLPLSGWSSNQELSSASGSMLPLSGESSSGDIVPTYTVSTGVLSPMVGISAVLVGEVGTGSGTLLPITGLSANRPYATAYGAMEPMDGFSQERSVIDAYASLTAPSFDVYGVGHDSTGEQAATLFMPSPTLSAYGGANAKLKLPKPLITITATNAATGTAEIITPKATLVATGTVSGTGQANLTFGPVNGGTYSLVGYSGAVLSVTLPSGTLTATGSSGGVGRAAITLPLFELSATGTVNGLSYAALTMPTPRMGATARAALVMPFGVLTAIGSAVVAVSYEAYAVNLGHQPKPGKEPVDEVTRYTNFPFTHIVRYQNSYFGANSTGLYLLEGTTDYASPTPTAIPWAFKTAMTDFKSQQHKTVASAYFGGRLGAAATIDLHVGEDGPQTYSYATVRTDHAQNYRQVFGKGTKARYYALGASGTGTLELDDIDFDVHTLSRRI